MATANEILASLTGDNDRVCVIDLDTRKILIPASVTTLGVESDDGVKRLYFKMTKTYRGTDLSSGFSIRINYINANDDPASFSPAREVTVNDDVIGFYWRIDRDVVAYKGDVKFIICLKRSDADGNVEKELNTTVASLPSLEGLEADMESIQVKPIDYLAQLLAVKDEYVGDISSEGDKYLQNLDAKHEELENQLRDTATILSNGFGRQYGTRANAIVCTAEGESVIIDDASEDYIRGLRVFGKSTQETDPTPTDPKPIYSIMNPKISICGHNLFNFNGITDTSDIKRNTDGSLTVTIYSAPTGTTLRKLAPELIAGERYTMYIDTDSPNKFVYFLEPKSTWSADHTITVSDEMLDAKLYIYGVNGDAPMVIRDISIVREGVVYNGEPYIAPQTITLNRTLHGIPVIQGSAHYDQDNPKLICDEIDFERGVYVQRALVQQFTGRETWTTNPLAESQGVTAYHMYTANGDAEFALGLCSHFVNGGAWSGGLSSKTNVFWTANTTTVVFKTDGVQSLDDFLNFLRSEYESGNPVTLYSVLRTPKETPLTDAELATYSALHSNYPNTTVLNDAGAHMELKYNADTAKFLETAVDAYLDKYLATRLQQLS